jgi:small subunit ribosomal protein S14
MAKKSVIHRNKKRERLVAKFAAKRASLKSILSDPATSEEEFYKAQAKLTKLPKNSSPVRLVNRCTLTGRSRATINKICGTKLKIYKRRLWVKPEFAPCFSFKKYNHA